ncbi:hypothetical protein [Streptomyces sp. NPDC051183]|uniref:hypothetical protein n=1 Tax=unclassified Streptomyces TaxID=2593676 RepID=UPI0034476337
MSFGDPNNPYGQQQGQPGYGYPQQAPQGGYPYPQQAPAPHGYPGHPPYPVVPGAYPGMPVQMRMPGLMKTARVFLFIIGGLQLLVAAFAIFSGVALSTTVSNTSGDLTGGLIIAIGAAAAAFALVPIILGARFAKGRNGVRVTTIIYGTLGILGSLGNLGVNASDFEHSAVVAPVLFSAAIGLTISVIIFASMVNSSATVWFNRPRY